MARAGEQHLACPTAPVVAKLGAVDLAKALCGLGERDAAAVLAVAGVRHRPGTATRGTARLLAARLARLRPEAAHDVAVLLTTEMHRRASFLISRDGNADDARFATGLTAVLPALVGEWSFALVRLQLTLLAETGVLEGDEAPKLMAALAALAEVGAEAAVAAGDPAGAKPAATATMASEPVPDDDGDIGEPDSLALGPSPTSALDAVLAVVITDAAAGRSGFPPLAELVAAVAELLALDPARPGSWRLRGAIDAHGGTDLGPAAIPPTRDAGDARLAGRFAALTRGGDDPALGDAAVGDLGAVARLLASGGVGDDVATATIIAVVAATGDGAPELLAAAAPVTGWPTITAAVRDRAAELLEADEAIPAERLLRATDEMLGRWARGDDCRGGVAPDRVALERAAAEIAVVRAECRRRRRDFVGAFRLLASLPADALSSRGSAAAACELALARAGIAGAGDLRVPATPSERAAFAARIEEIEGELDAALDLAPDALLPRWLSGVLAVCRGDDRRAVHDLRLVEAGLAGDGDPVVVATLRFHHAVAQLRLLQPGTDAEVCRAIDAALGITDPPPHDLVAACDALAAHGSPELGRILGEVARRHPGDRGVRELVARHATDGDDGAVAAAVALGTDHELPLAERFALLEAALDGVAASGRSGRVDEIVAALEDVLVRADDAGLDVRWAALLATNRAGRDLLGPGNADAARVDVLRRLGRLDEARATAIALFFRAAAGALTGHDPEAILDLLAELDVPVDELAGLARLVTARPAVVATETARPPGAKLRPRCRVLVVGGDEAQDRHLGTVPAAIAASSHGDIDVRWFPTGWGSGWSRHADRAEAAYADSDAMVLMTAMRTMLGRRLRRTAGEAGLIWVACTGHGRPALERAIDRAVALAQVSTSGGG